MTGLEPARFALDPWVSPAEWETYCGLTAHAYKKLSQFWILADRAAAQRAPRDAAAYMKAGAAAIRRADPQARILWACRAPVAEHLVRLLGNTTLIDIRGNRRVGAGKWVYLRDQLFSRKYKLPLWNFYAVDAPLSEDVLFDPAGAPVPAAFADAERRQDAIMFDVIAQMALSEPRRFGCRGLHYGTGVDEPGNLFAADGRLKMGAIQFINAVQFCRDATRGGLIAPDKAANVDAVFLFKGDEVWVSLRLRAPAVEKEITLKYGYPDLTVLDRGLGYTPFDRTDGGIVFNLARGRMRLLRSKRREDLLAAVRGMEARDVLAVRHMVLKSDKGCDYACYLKNNSAGIVAGSVGALPELAAGEPAQAFKLKKDEAVTLRFPLRPEETRHLTCASLGGVVRLDNALAGTIKAKPRPRAFPTDEQRFPGASLWLHGAPRAAERPRRHPRRQAGRVGAEPGPRVHAHRLAPGRLPRPDAGPPRRLPLRGRRRLLCLALGALDEGGAFHRGRGHRRQGRLCARPRRAAARRPHRLLPRPRARDRPRPSHPRRRGRAHHRRSRPWRPLRLRPAHPRPLT